ncbi:WD40 repeat-like protein [Mytilinidion resinicola]|uniref:WD40 repeat-like protein n=1 Tax=Mytilinidion resinicola TaxID=574789 RepID=A0A6A6YFY9_9PEZI|nr:WD40 repeat-like protein [Mytilinidion resinicola]KAF2806955.1 WD40 repeat-like protein [Mytilinidion resinicola]
MIGLEASRVRDWKRPAEITKDELQGDRYDIQGINWEELDTTREKARAARLRLSTRKATPPPPLPSSENYFRFRKMNTTHRISVAHFQLRNLIAAISRSDIFYASKSKVMHTDASGQMNKCAMELTKPMGDSMHPSSFSITTLTASDEVLIAGGFYGEYALTNLRSEVGEPHVQGYVTHEFNGITNHAHTFDSRSSGLPQGVFCSNDHCLRILDCTTNTFTHEFRYKQAINCSATSPNGRMRVIVGDFDKALITDAETGRPFEHLPSHTDHVFACAWADDGIHVATGSQDHKIVVWDARRWDTPLATFASVMSCPRSLRFSPVGGGRRVLFAAEAEDIVSVFDAYDFDKRQVLDFYGATAGISVTPDGQSLFVANGDGKFGGLMEFERCQFAEPWGLGEPRRSWKGHRIREERFPRGAWEWMATEDLDDDPRVVGSRKARERRGLGLEKLYV